MACAARNPHRRVIAHSESGAVAVAAAVALTATAPPCVAAVPTAAAAAADPVEIALRRPSVAPLACACSPIPHLAPRTVPVPPPPAAAATAAAAAAAAARQWWFARRLSLRIRLRLRLRLRPLAAEELKPTPRRPPRCSGGAAVDPRPPPLVVAECSIAECSTHPGYVCGRIHDSAVAAVAAVATVAAVAAYPSAAGRAPRWRRLLARAELV